MRGETAVSTEKASVSSESLLVPEAWPMSWREPPTSATDEAWIGEMQAFADQAMRVGRRVFVTTPNRWVPVELHTRLPLVHWLPEPAAHRVYDLVRKPWAKENHLLGPGNLERLFRGRARIVNLGMTLVAIV